MKLTDEHIEEFKDRIIAAYLIRCKSHPDIVINKEDLSVRVWGRPGLILPGIKTKDLVNLLGTFMLEKELEKHRENN